MNMCHCTCGAGEDAGLSAGLKARKRLLDTLQKAQKHLKESLSRTSLGSTSKNVYLDGVRPLSSCSKHLKWSHGRIWGPIAILTLQALLHGRTNRRRWSVRFGSIEDMMPKIARI